MLGYKGEALKQGMLLLGDSVEHGDKDSFEVPPLAAGPCLQCGSRLIWINSENGYCAACGFREYGQEPFVVGPTEIGPVAKGETPNEALNQKNR